MLKFPEMPYERPDIEAAKQFLAQAAARLEAAESFEAADAVFVEVNERSTQLDTMFTISHIRHDINTEDKFYDAEVEFADAALPELQEYADRWNRALVFSRWRPGLEEKYSRVAFLNKELALRAFSPEIVPELQRENALCTEYSKLLASAQIEFEGGVYTLSQLTPFKQDPDDERRLAAWKAEGAWYMSHADKARLPSTTSWCACATRWAKSSATRATSPWATTVCAATATPRRTSRASARPS